MTLSEWIDERGVNEAKKKFKTDSGTISLWRNARSLPRPKRLVRLSDITQGEISIEETIRYYASKNR